jgi:hypothetical protein
MAGKNNWAKWVAVLLKNGASIFVAAAGTEVTRYCVRCLVNRKHAVTNCQHGNEYHFCRECGQHN